MDEFNKQFAKEKKYTVPVLNNEFMSRINIEEHSEIGSSEHNNII